MRIEASYAPWRPNTPVPVNLLKLLNLRKVVCSSVDEATASMKPPAKDVLNKWPVSKRVNSSRASDEDETLISQV